MKHNEEFHLRLMESEHELLNKKADEFGLSKAQLVRNYINEQPTIDRELRSLITDMINAVNKIGTNINQIARKANENSLTANDVLSMKTYQKLLVSDVEDIIKYCLDSQTVK